MSNDIDKFEKERSKAGQKEEKLESNDLSASFGEGSETEREKNFEASTNRFSNVIQQ